MAEDVVRAVAQYLRMSTERQTYSLEYQAAANAAYAATRNWRVVETFADPGISGLTLNARPGLKALLAAVLADERQFDAVLVYDVSRWGRFQDLDQGAHLEFLCREAGVHVIYTAEAFENDGSFTSAILKHLRRLMAAEYSRELSAKVARAQRGLQAEGYWVGGAPGYGFRRAGVQPGGSPRFTMEPGEQKAIRGYRTRLVPGPAEEVLTVRRIYSLFVVAGLRMVSIAHLLNVEGITAEGGGRWSRQRVRNILTNEKYAGVLLGRKSEGALDGVRRLRSSAEWVRAEHGVQPLVGRQMFDLAQAQIRQPKHRRPTDDDLLGEVRRVLADYGRLSGALIDRHPIAHCTATYKNRFGSLEAVYRRVGYEPSLRQRTASQSARARRQGRFQPRADCMTREEGWARLLTHYGQLGRVSSNTIDIDPNLPSADWYRARFGGMADIYERLGYEPTARQKFHIGLTRRGAPKYRRPR